MKKLILFLLIILVTQKAGAFEWRNGDLIFQESGSEEGIGNAIKNVTQSAEEYRFTHVGIVYIPDGKEEIFVIEATTPQVRMVPLNEYLFPNGTESTPPLSVVGRLKEEYQHCIPLALQEAMTHLGKAYDYGFILGNDAYYCSELIYEIFLKANNNQPVFPLNKMTFKVKDTDEFDSNWLAFFKEKKLDIPEGEWGINPGAMSRSDVIDLLGAISIQPESHKHLN